MEREAKGPRSHENEIIIDAPIEAVWKALTDAEELTRWLCDSARVTPGAGGRIWSAWGEGGQQDEGKLIEVWEPDKRLKLLMDPASQNTGPATTSANLLTVPIVLDYTLETREGKTVLRLVHSGIPDAPEWDGFYEGTKAGWPMFFIGLRHYLEKHAGKRRDGIVLMEPITDSPGDAWNKFKEVTALEPAGPGGSLAAGNGYRATAAGSNLDGRIEIYNPPKIMLLTIGTLSDALLAVAFEEMQGMQFAYIALSIYGWDQSEVKALKDKWLGWLKALFPSPDPPGTKAEA